MKSFIVFILCLSIALCFGQTATAPSITTTNLTVGGGGSPVDFSRSDIDFSRSDINFATTNA